jgi:hypothetical protein
MQPLIPLPDFSMAAELWWVSLTLMTVSLGFGLDVHHRYSATLRKIKEKRTRAGRAKVRNLLKRAKSRQIRAIENKIFSMPDYRVSALEPSRRLNLAFQFYLFAGLVFLGSLLIRLSIDNGIISAQNTTGWEWILFVLALFGFLIALFYHAQLILLVDREGD